MRAYRLSNKDIVIDVRPGTRHGKTVLRCITVWTEEGYCFKNTTTNETLRSRLNGPECAVLGRQLSKAIAAGLGQHIVADPIDKPWYDQVKEALPNRVQELLP